MLSQTIIKLEDEEILTLWRRTCSKIKQEGECDEYNCIIDICWEIIVERGLLPPGG
jgi:hypothetical protein